MKKKERERKSKTCYKDKVGGFSTPYLAKPKEKQEPLPVTALSFQQVFLTQQSSAPKPEGTASRAASGAARRKKPTTLWLLRKGGVSGSSASTRKVVPYCTSLNLKSRCEEQTDRIPQGFGESLSPYPCSNLTEKLKPTPPLRKQVTCPESHPRVRAGPRVS